MGTFFRKLVSTMAPSMPSSPGRPPEPPTTGCTTETREPPVSKSGTATIRMEPWPESVAGSSSGTACASAAMLTSHTLCEVEYRVPQPAPGSGSRIEPLGMRTFIGRTSPAL